MLLPLCFYWLMLLLIMLWLMLLPLCFILADVIANYVMADVIAIMFLLADVIANYVLWDIVPHLYCVCGRCYDHLCDWLMLLPWWQMELATVGMCRCIKVDVKTLLADVMAMDLYFIFSSVVLTRTSSHT